ncbi:uncharacterized protein LOC141853123 [Brevipalpus obovatus]|uniref:uncharacterized protein LOC141853123 n=1 Tax=Brevipalpus obovatus TaxID=246614 RepID=UPI003D9F6485
MPPSRRPTELIENPVELVPVIEGDVNLSIIERKLKIFFKCCFFRGQKCFYTTNETSNFLLHMQKKHQDSSSLFCFYCYNDGNDTHFDEVSDLIDHSLIEHSLRRYQCNLCFYRASSKTHVLLHQANTHGDKFRATMKGTSSEMCKVLVCPQLVAAANPGPITYWKNFRKKCTTDLSDDENSHGNYYRCLYCDFRASSDHSVFAHVSKCHCDYPLVIHDKWHDPILPVPDPKETDDNEQALVEELPTEDPDDDELDNIVNQIYNPDENGDDYGPRDELPPSPEPVQDEDEPSTSDNNTRISHEIPKDKQPAQNIKQKGQIAKKRVSPLVRPLPEPPKESSSEESEDEYVSRPTRKPRGFIPENVNVHELIPLTITKPGSLQTRNLFQCIICNDKEPIRHNAITSHVLRVHKAQGSLKCSECNFIGSKLEILQHGKDNHPTVSATVVKFIIGLDDESSGTIMRTGKSTSRPAFATKKSAFTPSSKPGPKSFHEKNLSTKIKASTFVGPKNWTKEKPSTSEKASSGSDIDSDPDSPQELDPEQPRERKFIDNTIVERMNDTQRGCSHFFCLFCDRILESYDLAFACMRKHLGVFVNCPDCSFRAGSTEELRIHHKSAHPGVLLKRQKGPSGTFDKDNYITEFINDQFRFCRKASEMNEEQLSKKVYIVCPICEKANKLLGQDNFRFTQWRSFKIHFWKHSGSSRIFCTACSCYVTRTRKHLHILEQHATNEEDDDEDAEPENPYLNYEDRHRFLEDKLTNLKKFCKSIYIRRLKEFHGIDKELSVILHRIDPVKQEPEQEPMDVY